MTVTGDRKFGAPIGRSTLGATFDEDWGTGAVFQTYTDYIAFNATATINMPRTGLATFKIGSDDGARLVLDEQEIVSNWREGHYVEQSAKVLVAPGKHQLLMQYYDVGDRARVSFECDHDLLVWEEDE